MRKPDILEFASELYTTAFNHARNRITKTQADIQVYETINRFIDKLRKDTGYQDGKV